MNYWDIKPLGQICSMRPPKAEVRTRLSPTDLVSFVPMNDLGDGSKFFLPREEKALADVEAGYTYFANNDVLLAKITPCFENGKLGIARNLTNGVGFGSSEYFVLRPSARLDPEFLYYFLAQDSFRKAGQRLMSGAVGHKRVPKEYLEDLPFPLPSLPEQRRIVAILDEAFAGLEVARVNAARNLSNARDLFNAYLNADQGFMVNKVARRRLASLCEGDRIITYGVIKLGKEMPDGVPCLRTSNVRWLNIDIDGMKRISGTLSAEYRRTILRGGEVLVNVRGTLGGVAVTTPHMAGWNVSREVAVVPSDPKEIDARYLAFWIAKKSSQAWLTDKQKGVAYSGINIEDLRELPVAVPTLSTQRVVIKKLDYFLENSRHLASLYTRKLAAIAELRQSLLQKAFSGELTASESLAA